ncbi:MAG: hypothetical protein LBD37_00045 [Treponema sp.]|jgi:dissimilatory sulfite reductase (desulfoviridin) alpha/beta subunit|nr:hypothetical protein [Treponema sp.]
MESNAAALKSKGFFQQVQEAMFSLRLCSSGGTLSAAYVRSAVAIAETYGAGQIHLTTRQQIEIPFIPAEKVASVQRVLEEADIKTFIGGPRARTVAACLGSAVCKFGKIETSGLAREIHQKYFGRELPAKLKIAVTGCKNNCARIEANDIGIRGADEGYVLYFGGCFGHETRVGKPLLPALAAREDALNVLEAGVDFFAHNAAKGERLGKLIERVGPEAFRKILEKAL